MEWNESIRLTSGSGYGSEFVPKSSVTFRLQEKSIFSYFCSVAGPDPGFFSSAFQKQNNFQFCEIYGYTKKGMTTNFFSPLSFVEDPGWVKNQDPRSEINIPVPQHCVFECFKFQ
jgi:hypothetical protein